MFDDTESNTEQRDRHRAAFLTLLAITSGLTVAFLAMPAGTGVDVAAAAQENNTTNSTLNETYYANESGNISFSGWMAGHTDASLANATHFLTRLGPFVIGSGFNAQGGVGAAGVMVFGLVLFGAVIASSLSAGVGPVGGATISMITGAGLAFSGLAPMWMYAVGLFALGLVLLKVYTTVLR